MTWWGSRYYVHRFQSSNQPMQSMLAMRQVIAHADNNHFCFNLFLLTGCLMHMGHSCWNYHITIKTWHWSLTYFVFTNSIFVYMIMDRCIYLNHGHFVTKLNNGFLISGRTFYPQKFITVTMEKFNCWLKVYNKLKLIESTTAKFT